MTQAPSTDLEVPPDDSEPQETEDAEPKAAEAEEPTADDAPDIEAPADGAQPAVEVQDVDPPPAADAGARRPAGKIDVLLGTAMDVTVTLGGAEMPIRDVLELAPGSVVTLDRQVGEPADLWLNGVRFATGHLVVVGDQLGVRIKDVMESPEPAPAAAEG
jgi:flagellar motor switch protein FliN/FliY